MFHEKSRCATRAVSKHQAQGFPNEFRMVMTGFCRPVLCNGSACKCYIDLNSAVNALSELKPQRRHLIPSNSLA